jgi:hypothetical protein
MDGLMTEVTNNEGFSPAGRHNFYPSWSFSPLLFEIRKLADMMDFHVFP